MINVIKLIDYTFQSKSQLEDAYDDSNSMRYLDPNLNVIVIGRYAQDKPSVHSVENDKYRYSVIFLPSTYSAEEVIKFIESLSPDVLHMHGNHGWPAYPVYAKHFNHMLSRPKMIFSPAGSSCGTPDFLWNFDYIIVNHKDQIKRMKVAPGYEHKVIVRKRSADPNIFYPMKGEKFWDFVYVAGFVPVKRLDLMIDTVAKTPYSMVILGDFARTKAHYGFIKKYIEDKGVFNRVDLYDFIPQKTLAKFLSNCKCFVWPNIKPENPETTTNRSAIEALACGMPLLLGERAFRNSEFIIDGYNGFKYHNDEKFRVYADEILNEKYCTQYRVNSSRQNENFNFKTNFINFYNKLYGGWS